MIGFSVPVPYSPVMHDGHVVNPQAGHFVVYSPTQGFKWQTLACTEKEALNKNISPSSDDQMAKIEFTPT